MKCRTKEMEALKSASPKSAFYQMLMGQKRPTTTLGKPESSYRTFFVLSGQGSVSLLLLGLRLVEEMSVWRTLITKTL